MASIWAIADLHLSFGTPNKKMDIFGERWVDHEERVKKNWHKLIKSEDLILIAGDISWGMTPEQARPDLEWIDALPGTKVMVKGNHDYWWTSLKKVESLLPASIHLVQNNSFLWNDVAIAGTRLWDNIEFNFDEYIEFTKNESATDKSSPVNNCSTIALSPSKLLRIFTGCWQRNRRALPGIVNILSEPPSTS